MEMIEIKFRKTPNAKHKNSTIAHHSLFSYGKSC